MAARDRILDAVEALIGRSGFKSVSIASVAAEAGVSRQTVYANFGTLEDLIAEAILGVSTRALNDIGEKLEPIADAGEYAVELLVTARAQFRDIPALAVLVFPDSGNPVFDADMFATATPLVEIYLAPLFERAPQLRERREDVLELLLRTGLSVLMFDSALLRSDEGLRGYLTRTLLPALGL